MTSQDEGPLSAVQQRLTEIPEFRVTREAPDQIVVETDGAAPVALLEHRAGDQCGVAIVARVLHESSAAPRDILRLAAMLGAGAYALVGDSYVLRLVIAPEDLETAPLDKQIGYVRAQAKAVADMFAGTKGNDTTFSW